jgi:hypothetical protein
MGSELLLRGVVRRTGREYSIHKGLRIAYRSLKINLPSFLVDLNYIQLNLPNTTKAKDGHSPTFKHKIRNQNGRAKKKEVDGCFSKN